MIKLSYLISAVDPSKKPNDPEYLRIFLDNNKEVPHLNLLNFETDEIELLKTIHSTYLKCDFNFYPKILAGFRVLDSNTCEVCYTISVRYFKNVAMNGSWYTLSEIQENNILLEEYHGELLFRSRNYI